MQNSSRSYSKGDVLPDYCRSSLSLIGLFHWSGRKAVGCTFSLSFVGQKWIRTVTHTCWHYSRLGQIPTVLWSVFLVTPASLYGLPNKEMVQETKVPFLWCVSEWLGSGLGKAERQPKVLMEMNGCACMFMDSCGRASHSSTHFFQSEKVVVNMWVLCTALKISSPVQVREMPRALSLSQRSLGPIQYQQARRYS